MPRGRRIRNDGAVASTADGRERRSARSREAIVQALFELIGSGVLRPTAQQVAAAAGVGMRSVFRHFADMESLFAEMHKRLEAEAVPILLAKPIEGPVGRRARDLVDRRVEFFERIAPYKRSGNVERWRSAFLREQHTVLVRVLRSNLLQCLPELAPAPVDLVEAFDLVLSFEAWDRLRSDQRLGRDRARTALRRIVTALVAELAH
jgi:AcrR family transcriptional regulator